jgi:CIC family chloride channel protein
MRTERSFEFPGARATARSIKLMLGLIESARGPIEFQLLGRVLLQAALVGAAAGLIGSVFFAGVEALQRVALESWAGYVPLRAAGEEILRKMTKPVFRPWLLLV